ncbi:hypothetical protein J6590_071313 [Homalodisca vitripennis]|nr:hypothetical protein J6590_071313 [Homalodisca vitripennis]
MAASYYSCENDRFDHKKVHFNLPYSPSMDHSPVQPLQLWWTCQSPCEINMVRSDNNKNRSGPWLIDIGQLLFFGTGGPISIDTTFEPPKNQLPQCKITPTMPDATSREHVLQLHHRDRTSHLLESSRYVTMLGAHHHIPVATVLVYSKPEDQYDISFYYPLYC